MDATLLGAGAMNSPRYAPAGLLVACGGQRVMLDGGPGAVPEGAIDAWLVTDASAELIRPLRALAERWGLRPAVDGYHAGRRERRLHIEPRSVEHTSHPTYGYLLRCGRERVVWAPEFWDFPSWAAGADLMFADAAGWTRPIRFARGVGGHAAVRDTAHVARQRSVRRLVFAHIGRPSLRAIDAGHQPPYGQWAREGHRYRVTR